MEILCEKGKEPPIMLADLIEHRARIEEKREVLIPDIRWSGTRRRSQFLNEE